ncbi:hypothetical protein [Alkaliflexus imshenetskii]|nr:hypothetical protein [Alkaliflexus imshenetskii]
MDYLWALPNQQLINKKTVPKYAFVYERPVHNLNVKPIIRFQ